MTDYVTEFFASTTAEDQRAFFSGEVQEQAPILVSRGAPPAKGTYRVIDGNLCKIITGLSIQEVRSKLQAPEMHRV